VKLSDEQIAAFHAQHAAWVRAQRAALLLGTLLEAAEIELHIDTPPGQHFDIWGDGELKPNADCKPVPK